MGALSLACEFVHLFLENSMKFTLGSASTRVGASHGALGLFPFDVSFFKLNSRRHHSLVPVLAHHRSPIARILAVKSFAEQKAHGSVLICGEDPARTLCRDQTILCHRIQKLQIPADRASRKQRSRWALVHLEQDVRFRHATTDQAHVISFAVDGGVRPLSFQEAVAIRSAIPAAEPMTKNFLFIP